MYRLYISIYSFLHTHTDTGDPLNLNHNAQSQNTCTAANPTFNAQPQGPQTQLARNVSYIYDNGGTVSLSDVLTLDKHTNEASWLGK